MFHHYRVIGLIESPHCHNMQAHRPNTSAFQVAFCRSESTIDARRQSCRVCIAASRDRSIGEETIDDLALIVLYDSARFRLPADVFAEVVNQSTFRFGLQDLTCVYCEDKPRPKKRSSVVSAISLDSVPVKAQPKN